jgi:hypothetical protein
VIYEADPGERQFLDNPEGTGKFWHTRLIGSKAQREMPQAFRVEMPPEFVITPHFHAVDQYQIFIAGSGRIGREEARAVTVHYSDHHTAYGPIIAGASGFTYLTLRQRPDSGAVMLSDPDFRSRLRPSPKRHHTVSNLDSAIEPVLCNRAASSIEPVVAADASGLASWRMHIAPRTTLPGPDPSQGAGQYYLVTNGEIVGARGLLEQWSLIFVDPTEDCPPIAAGGRGAEVLVLQFPRLDAPELQ